MTNDTAPLPVARPYPYRTPGTEQVVEYLAYMPDATAKQISIDTGVLLASVYSALSGLTLRGMANRRYERRYYPDVRDLVRVGVYSLTPQGKHLAAQWADTPRRIPRKGRP